MATWFKSFPPNLVNQGKALWRKMSAEGPLPSLSEQINRYKDLVPEQATAQFWEPARREFGRQLRIISKDEEEKAAKENVIFQSKDDQIKLWSLYNSVQAAKKAGASEQDKKFATNAKQSLDVELKKYNKTEEDLTKLKQEHGEDISIILPVNMTAPEKKKPTRKFFSKRPSEMTSGEEIQNAHGNWTVADAKSEKVLIEFLLWKQSQTSNWENTDTFEERFGPEIFDSAAKVLQLQASDEAKKEAGELLKKEKAEKVEELVQ